MIKGTIKRRIFLPIISIIILLLGIMLWSWNRVEAQNEILSWVEDNGGKVSYKPHSWIESSGFG